MKNKIKLYSAVPIISIVVFGSMYFIQHAYGLSIKLKNTKPTATAVTQPAVLSDEQQAILAVRTAKASVVNIVGQGAINPNGLDGVSQSAGTGVIIDGNGYIVSNSHVVNNPNASYEVIFSDGSRYKATVVGTDTYVDLALIKIEASGLPAAKLGDSNALETGQTVFAIGNSLGRYQNTVTRGVVSGLGRNVAVNTSQPRMRNLIQTDASINPGNSGGPLVNMNGEVVGINTLIDVEGQGVGFSIPASIIKNAIDQLRLTGKVSHPYLGIQYQTIDKTIQAYRKLTVNQGAFVTTILAGGPAAKAGLQAGDVIISINGQPLTESNELDIALQNFQAGNAVEMVVIRAGQNMTIQVMLGEYQQ